MLNKFDRTQFERLEILFSKPTKCTTSWKIYRFGMESSESWERLISLNKIVQRSYIWPIEFVTIRKHRTRSNRTSWPIDRLRRVDTRWNERKIMRNRGIRSEKVEKSVWLIWGKKGNRNRYGVGFRGGVIRKLTFHGAWWARKVGERRRQIVPLWNLFVRKGRKSWADRGRLWKREVFERDKES